MESPQEEESLSQPLLANQVEGEYAENSTWPKASEARFLCNPKDPEKKTDRIECKFEWNCISRTIDLIPAEDVEDKDEDDSPIIRIDPSDVVGAQLEISFDDKEEVSSDTNEEDTPTTRTKPKNPSAAATLYIYTYPKETKGLSSCSFLYRWLGYDGRPAHQGPLKRRAEHYHLPLVKSEDFGAVNQIVEEIRNLAGIQKNKQQRLLVVLNPHSGTGKAQSIYDATVDPMLSEAGIDHTVFVTQHAGHATKRMLQQDEEDITKFTGIVAMGGDGILYEVLQGLQKREDYKAVMEMMTFGIVGCGTSNGMAKSILLASGEHYGVLESTFLMCKGGTSNVDLARYQTANNSHTAFLSYSYGFVADCDLESEVLHFLGSLRTDIWAVWRILTLRRYPVRLSYLPPSADNGTDLVVPNLSLPLDQEWKVIDDDIITLWACQTTHAAYNIHSSPESKLDDGLFHILLVRGSASRYNLIQMFLSVESGEHIQYDHVEVIKCRAFRLEPGDGSRASYNDVDGEAVESGVIQGQVIPREMKMFTKIR